MNEVDKVAYFAISFFFTLVLPSRGQGNINCIVNGKVKYVNNTNTGNTDVAVSSINISYAHLRFPEGQRRMLEGFWLRTSEYSRYTFYGALIVFNPLAEYVLLTVFTVLLMLSTVSTELTKPITKKLIAKHASSLLTMSNDIQSALDYVPRERGISSERSSDKSTRLIATHGLKESACECAISNKYVNFVDNYLK